MKEMTIIDTTEMSQSEQEQIGLDLWQGEGGIAQIMQIETRARAGTLDPEPRTITSTYHGQSREEALGRAYEIRDTLRNNGHDASAELTGKAYKLEDTTLFEFALHINGGSESSEE